MTLTLILTACLVVLTAIYAILTWRIAKANEAAVAAMKEQVESASRPFLTVTDFVDTNTLISLLISNTGKSNAQKVRLSIDKPFYQASGNRPDSDIGKTYAFKNEIQTWPPDTKLRFALTSAAALSTPQPNQPFIFSITAEYSFFGRTVKETTTIDLNKYVGTFMPQQSPDVSLEIIADHVKSAEQLLQKRFAP